MSFSTTAPLTSRGRLGRTAIKRLLYSTLYLRDAFGIMLGRAKPLVRFTVEATPPSIYVNFSIGPEHKASIERELGLPLPLAPIVCLEGEEPFHCLTLNVYRVSGLARGLRAEWSVYVRDPGGKPRYMVVEAQTETGSLDSVGLLSRPGPIGYTEADGWLAFEVGSEDGTSVGARVRRRLDAPVVRLATQWIEANELIYWRNGVCDRTFYDSRLANAPTRLVDPTDVTIEDDTAWCRFVDPIPRHVVVFDGSFDLAMSPWWNLDELTH